MNRDDRLNCWEFMNCGREPNGDRVGELGVCPAAEDQSFDGLNRGRNAGRLCWAVAGTFCGGEIQGSFVEKRRSCMDCDFFQHVHREEGSGNGQTGFLEFLSDAQPDFLAQLTCRQVRAGERFITQGETDGTAYIIDRGACLAIVEKNGDLHPVGHRGEGDIVGELALLTGEPQPAHVEAQTDATLWVLPRRAFEDLSKEDPDLLDFLTELTADRLDSRRPVADRQIGKYTATEIIGRGGYSIVYRGVHTGLDLPVAIKMMRHDLAADPVFLAGFRNEAKTIAALDHENIVRVYDIEERFRTMFIIMEHVRGESLQSLLRRLKRLPPRLIVSFLLQVCAGLDYAHGRGIVHRDIKPDNIIVGPNDRIKILDFGLACPPGADDCQIGTVFYLAPEQITGDRIDPRTDIYSLGVAAYEMATGTRPFPGASPAELQRLHTQKDIPDPAKIVPDLPRGLRWFILKACRRDPAQRYQTAAEALSALYPVADGLGIDARFTGPKTQKMTGLFLIYDARQEGALNRILAEFSEKAAEIGAVVKVAEAGDVKKKRHGKNLVSNSKMKFCSFFKFIRHIKSIKMPFLFCVSHPSTSRSSTLKYELINT